MALTGWPRLYRSCMSMMSWAACQAERLLSPLGDRWLHVRQVAEQARRVIEIVPLADRELLVAAAYLHDIGYAPTLVVTRFHPLDGARWVRDSGQDERLARLVAHHSCAIHEARVRGLLDQLLSDFEPEESVTYDALVFCDMITGPTGKTVSLAERLNEIDERYGEDHEVTRAIKAARPYLTACCERTLIRLGDA